MRQLISNIYIEREREIERRFKKVLKLSIISAGKKTLNFYTTVQKSGVSSLFIFIFFTFLKVSYAHQVCIFFLIKKYSKKQ